MYVHNYSVRQEFYLCAFTRYGNLQLFIFIAILSMYLLCVIGNIFITAIVCLSPQLHTPMYYFLCNLTVLDIIYVSVILPKLMVVTITDDIKISYPECFAQVFFYVFCIGTEFFILASMAYDRYMAICAPLHYMLSMNPKTCATLSVSSLSLGVLNAMMYPLLISKLSFSNSREINHFFCHMKSILKLCPMETVKIDLLITVDGIALGFSTFLLILISYIFIISTILKIQTSSGRFKAFSSCSSHLTVVLLFCLTSLTLNMKPENEWSQEQDKIISMLYIAVVPLLNPIVYSLRNKEVQKATKNILFKDHLHLEF
ncbi:olfactory receptor 8D1-like [Bufo gargarizans]|uniref:olfactory receptor 8D1-like n=1 Tax=Bufo gargarizans TaxID=30331 RepID=UPI001CF36ECF|nr:olfactory receptor 8D1-like [Bufo gargarizans]